MYIIPNFTVISKITANYFISILAIMGEGLRADASLSNCAGLGFKVWGVGGSWKRL